MNLTTILLLGKKAMATANEVFSVASLVIVPAMVTVPVVWALQTDGSLHSSGASYKTNAGAHAQIKSELHFSKPPLRVEYRLELLDYEGHVTFVYPAEYSRGIPQFDNLILQVPNNLRPGDYSLMARVTYAINPLKTNEQAVKVASIRVD